MLVKKYKAIVADSNIKVVGYLIEQRESIGNGCYSDKIQYCICVTEFSMPKSNERGCFIVKKETIKDFYPCAVCGDEEVKEEFYNSACSKKCYKEL